MKDAYAVRPIARADYQPARYLIEKVDLTFDLYEHCARVKSTLAVSLNRLSVPAVKDAADLILDGRQLKLLSIKRDGVSLKSESDYTLKAEKLIVHGMPEQCVIEIETEIYPSDNTQLEGLYQSSGNFCTQCEPEGFRRISYFPDRPDVMSCFDVKIIADKNRYPVLLSNGNLSASGEMQDGRHWACWHDPHPKPCYLFALVAGDLRFLQDSFVTASGRAVDLRIYVEPHNLDKCDHAMASLKHAMLWDEKTYGLEYDLDIYMIVAVDDFNMGAMENKGLNIFNSKYVLASQQTATDADFLGIQAVIAHEYFHNWTGNRVTCRDWFQLSLKEGLTVFRDQEFSAAMNSPPVKRIEDVRLLRARQFPEDAGPMAHPVRPDSYIEINNFYTVTIYEKGAEVIRMMCTLLGWDKFRLGMDLYFQRHDGQAVTCDDFVAAMETASGVDLQQFKLWYSQAGTPKLAVNGFYDEDRQQYRLSVKQSCAVTPGQPLKQPFQLPLSIALLDPEGRQIPLLADIAMEEGPLQCNLDITDAEHEFVFHHVKSHPVPSLLRGFSAPVIVDFEYSDAELAFLLAHDSDSFNRWDAGQQLGSRRIEQMASGRQVNAELDAVIFDGFGKMLSDISVDPLLRAEALRFPAIETIAERHEHFDIDNLGRAHDDWQRMLATALEPELQNCLITDRPQQFSVDSLSIGRRALHNRCLSLLVLSGDSRWPELALTQFNQSNNMTDRLAALTALLAIDSEDAEGALARFYSDWQSEKLVMDKWFAVQAMANTSSTISKVGSLLKHPDFDLTNPNRVRSLIGGFAVNNPVQFHAADGRGYDLLEGVIVQLDDINPQVAARLAGPFVRWRRFDENRQKKMKKCLKSIADKPGLSSDVYEIVSKALN